MSYGRRLLIAMDQFWNTVALGDPDETISSRIGRGAIAGYRLALICEAVIDAMPWFGPGHCRRSIGT